MTAENNKIQMPGGRGGREEIESNEQPELESELNTRTFLTEIYLSPASRERRHQNCALDREVEENETTVSGGHVKELKREFRRLSAEWCTTECILPSHSLSIDSPNRQQHTTRSQI